MTCPPLSRVVAWALGELESVDEEAFEEHLFSCAACEASVLQAQRLLAALRATLPPLLTAERRRQLEARHPAARCVRVQPGERGIIHLGPSAPVGLWVMSADLRDASRVDFEGMSSDAGKVFFSFADVPFDRERGEVVLPCHEHYRNMPAAAEIRVRLTATFPNGTKRATEYLLDHHYEDQ